MYCYIQEIQMKSSNSIGCGKELIVTATEWFMGGVSYKNYGYTDSDEKFERPIKTAHKISIHDKSYRDKNSKVKKKQYYLATIKYYEFIEYGYYNCIFNGKVEDIAENMDIETSALWKEISAKLDLLSDRINAEFEQTEEYEVKEKHDATIKEYQKNKYGFSQQFEVEKGEYDKCYDVFGVLRSSDYLKKIKSEYKKKKEYEEKSRSYQEDYYSNYTGGYGAGSLGDASYSDKEKDYLKKFYRALATKFHPDVTGDNETMQFINRLKEQWGI